MYTSPSLFTERATTNPENFPAKGTSESINEREEEFFKGLLSLPFLIVKAEISRPSNRGNALLNSNLRN